MREQIVRVDCSPGAAYFRVLVRDGDRYLLRHEEAQDIWSLAGYRASVVGYPTVRPEVCRSRRAFWGC